RGNSSDWPKRVRGPSAPRAVGWHAHARVTSQGVDNAPAHLPVRRALRVARRDHTRTPERRIARAVRTRAVRRSVCHALGGRSRVSGFAGTRHVSASWPHRCRNPGAVWLSAAPRFALRARVRGRGRPDLGATSREIDLIAEAPRANTARHRRAFAQVLAPFVVFAMMIGLWLFISYVLLEPRRRFLMPPPQEVVRVGLLDPLNLANIMGGLWSTTQVAL